MACEVYTIFLLQEVRSQRRLDTVCGLGCSSPCMCNRNTKSAHPFHNQGMKVFTGHMDESPRLHDTECCSTACDLKNCGPVNGGVEDE